MDLLYQRYASPFSFIDGMIQTGRFEEFVFEFIKLDNEQKEWEFYLHKIFDKSFAEFKSSVEVHSEPSNENLETIVQNSNSMLKNFIPDRG